MAEVNDMFNEITKEQSFYTKGRKTKFVPFAKGDYWGHITEVDSKVLDVKGGQYKARLYTYTFLASTENKDCDFQYEDIDGKMLTTKGHVYIGKKFKGKLWRFLEPSKGDTFESNPTGNAGYLRFCETIGVECPTETKTIDGEDVEVQLLPELSADMMLGQPVCAFVDKGRPFTNKEGETKVYWDVKFCKKWTDGTKKEISAKSGSDLPF
tara:strand:+ start:1628 stop:2257 length:630 start_codon:yes stop_codon:yes gene_type:complete